MKGRLLIIVLAALTGACSSDDNPTKPLSTLLPSTPRRALSFSLQPATTLGNLFMTIATGDLNRDGNADLVAASAVSPLVYLALGNGDGSFSTPLRVPIPARARWAADVVVGDWDQDGNPDIACNCGGDATVFLYGRGDGSFDSTLMAGTPFLHQGSPVVADFNRDGIDDYAGVNGDTAAVIVGDSGRLHRRIVSYVPPAIGWNPTFGTSADLDGDGKEDIALTRGGDPDHASVYYGNGNGTFRLPIALSDAGPNYGICTISRPHGDPGRDLAIAHVVGNSVGVIRRAGGTLIAEVTYPALGSPCGPASADFDHDGLEDLAVACTNGRSVAVLLGRADGTFDPAVYFDIANWPWKLAIADFNEDGLPDVAAIGDGAICVLLNTSNYRGVRT